MTFLTTGGGFEKLFEKIQQSSITINNAKHRHQINRPFSSKCGNCRVPWEYSRPTDESHSKFATAENDSVNPGDVLCSMHSGVVALQVLYYVAILNDKCARIVAEWIYRPTGRINVIKVLLDIVHNWALLCHL